MSLKTYLSDLDPQGREAFAQACDTTLGHLRNVMYGCRPCAPKLAAAIERQSGRKILRQELLPDDWREIWPELDQSGTGGAPNAMEAVAQKGVESV